jgi:hypothetical protein
MTKLSPSQATATLVALTDTDLQDLARAKHLLENPGVAARLASLAGRPFEQALERLPGRAAAAVNTVTRKAVSKALDAAVATMKKDTPRDGPRKASNWWHKAAVGVSGAAGGAFGLAGLAVELPISTTIMLRSIADIARSEGEDLNDPALRLECLSVLALGGPSARDDAADAGYFATRAALAKAVAGATEYLSKGAAHSSAPVVVKLIGDIASRFSVAVSEKAMAQAVPVIGALGGGVINALFIDHFQDMGRGHFIVRRLERRYGADAVREAYRQV